MTALARLMIFQGKEMEPTALVYEAGAILTIALGCLVVHFRGCAFSGLFIRK